MRCRVKDMRPGDIVRMQQLGWSVSLMSKPYDDEGAIAVGTLSGPALLIQRYKRRGDPMGPYALLLAVDGGLGWVRGSWLTKLWHDPPRRAPSANPTVDAVGSEHV